MKPIIGVTPDFNAGDRKEWGGREPTYFLRARYIRAIEELGGIQTREAEMSFSFADRGLDLHYAVHRGWGALFHQRRNLVSPRFYRLFSDLLRFRREPWQELMEGLITPEETLTGYLGRRGYSQPFIQSFVLPIGRAIWSVPLGALLEFPAATFLRFLGNHGYLGGGPRSHWRTIVGSSQQYVDRFSSLFTGTTRLNERVRAVERHESSVEVITAGGERLSFDHVILATHADQSLRLISQPTALEKRLLGAWHYKRTTAVLHTDTALMPTHRRLWASWNVAYDSLASPGAPQSAVTYHLNRVQGLASEKDYFVTLDGETSAAQVLKRLDYEHPVFDRSGIAAQSELARLNREGRLRFCGSYFGYGFHEDAMRSASEIDI